MVTDDLPGTQGGNGGALEEISLLLASSNEDILRSLLDHPAFDETQACLLLARADLPGTLLGEIAMRKTLRGSYRVRRALAAHPHTPRLIAMRLLRELHLMDLVRIGLLPGVSGEIRRLADERVLTQLPQLPLGQRLSMARRGSSRVAAGLIAEGPENVARAALDNAFLSESQLLKTLSKQSLPARIVSAVARHEKWSRLLNVRVAVLRHANAPAEFASALAAELARRDIEELLELTSLSASVREHLLHVLSHRDQP
jgi:hypothetical protein